MIVMGVLMVLFSFFLQAEDGIRDLVRSRGLGDVYKRQALDVFHGDEGEIAVLSVVVDGDDARMVESARGAGFILEALDDVWPLILQQILAYRLERNPALDDRILAEIDRAHAALAEDTGCLLYTSPSPRDRTRSRMPSSA